jgi:hypothetical protein
MAIVVEEEKSRINIIRLLGWLAILAIICAAIYYLFFAAPELVIISTPASFQNIAPIAQVTLHPEDVLNGAAYQSLRPPAFPLPTPQGPASVGRQNPFIAP